MSEGVYEGRLVTDGEGNLMSFDPDDPDGPKVFLAYHEGSFIVIGVGDPSHNDRHSNGNVLSVEGTRDADMVAAGAAEVGQDPANFEFLVNAGNGENMHHFETQEDDPHYDAEAPNKTRVKNIPDSVAPTMTGHTGAWNTND